MDYEKAYKAVLKTATQWIKDGCTDKEKICLECVFPELREEEIPNDLDFEQELYNRFGQIKDFTLGMRIGQYFYELGRRRTAEKCDEIEYNRQRAEQRWLEDRDGCFWDGVNEGKKAMEDAILALIESRLSEIIGDAQPKPILRMELQELINKIKQ